MRPWGEVELLVAVRHVEAREELSVLKAKEFDFLVLHGKVGPNCKDIDRLELDGAPEQRVGLRDKTWRACTFGHLFEILHPVGHEVLNEGKHELLLLLEIRAKDTLTNLALGIDLMSSGGSLARGPAENNVRKISVWMCKIPLRLDSYTPAKPL